MCKKILSHRIILAHILRYCIEDYADFTPKKIAEKYIEGKPIVSDVAVHRDEIVGMNTEDVSLNEETVRYDILFYSILPRTNESVKVIINVEIQNKYNPGYPLLKRALYYCSRMLSAQYGKEFSKSQYGDIKKVYSIWICPNAPAKRHNTICKYSIKEDCLLGNIAEDTENYDLMTVFMICLGNEEEENYDDVIELLSTLTTFKKKYSEIKDILENKFDIELTEEIKSEVSEMCNISEGIEERGINIGRSQGVYESIKKVMRSLSVSAEKAMDILEISDNDRDKYINMLAEQ
jgi:hypothetical protein